jgi:hypothetical protein
MRKRTAIALFVVGVFAFGGIAFAGSRMEHPQLVPPGAPAGYLSINGITCKFVHPEIDVRPSPQERLARTEDSRDDVKLQCLARRHTRYVRVQHSFDPSHHQLAAAVCPKGYHAVGGGATIEVGASFPSADLGYWIVGRDPLWRKHSHASVFAVCAGVVA